MSGSTAELGTVAGLSIGDFSSSLSTARSRSGATATTEAEILSPDSLACTRTWLAYRTRWALVMTRLPPSSHPEPDLARGCCLVQGLKKFGATTVVLTLTTTLVTGSSWAFAGT